jgi:hypothetical protein
LYFQSETGEKEHGGEGRREKGRDRVKEGREGWKEREGEGVAEENRRR